jgi:Uma2 family endonuclease
MVMPAVRTNWTVDELDALPEDGQRYELIDGELFVTPAPRDVHALVVGALSGRLYVYLRHSRVGRAIASPSDVRRGDYSRTRVQPDLFVLRLTDGKRPAYPYALGELPLVIEVLSPGSRRLDRVIKRVLYLSSGVTEYWIADPDARVITRYRNLADEGETLADRIEWHITGLPTALTIDLPELFAEALD